MPRPRPVMLLAYQLHQGGSERQLAAIAAGLDPARFAAHVGCFHDEGMRASELRGAGIPVTAFPVRSFRSPSAVAGAWQLARYLRRHRIEIVHPFDVPLTVFSVPVARAVGTPLVLSSQRASRHLTPGMMRRLLRFTDRLVDGTVVNCRALERELVAEDGVPASHLHLCPNGLDPDEFAPTPRVRMPALRDAACVVGTVAALRPEKGLRTLVEAFARVAPHMPGVKLAVVGSGTEGPVLEAMVHALGIASQCVFAPATREVAAWMRSIDVFVQPSLSEAFSNSVMEAMACGCCVVASDVGGNPELVVHDERGLLFPAGDAGALAGALARVLHDAPLRSRLAGAGTAYVRRHLTLRAAVGRMEALYDRLLPDAPATVARAA